MPPDLMPPELAAAGFEAAIWADSRRLPKPARRVVQRLFKVAKTEADVALAVDRAFRLADASSHPPHRGPSQQPSSRAARTSMYNDDARVFCASGESLRSNGHVRGAVTSVT